jgi:uncharacterized protein
MIGTALGRILAARGTPTLRLVRHAPSSPGHLCWDHAAAPTQSQLEALEGVTAAIHLSGANVAAHRWTAAYKREMIASRVHSTNALATALARLRTPPRVLLVASATGIYGNRGDEVLDESSVPGAGFLADLCSAWEAAAKPAIDAGIRVVNLRFGVVIGPAPGGALARMTPIFRLGLGGPLGNGAQWMSWISLDDAIAAILFAMATASLNGAVNLTAPHPVTNAEFTRALGRRLHRPAFVPAPAFALRLAFGQMADEALLSSARAIPARLNASGFEFTHPTIDQALAAALP